MKKLICKLMSTGLILLTIILGVSISTNAMDKYIRSEIISSDRRVADKASGIYYLDLNDGSPKRVLTLIPIDTINGIYKYDVAFKGEHHHHHRGYHRREKFKYTDVRVDDAGTYLYVFENRKHSYLAEVRKDHIVRLTVNEYRK